MYTKNDFLTRKLLRQPHTEPNYGVQCMSLPATILSTLLPEMEIFEIWSKYKVIQNIHSCEFSKNIPDEIILDRAYRQVISQVISPVEKIISDRPTHLLLFAQRILTRTMYSATLSNPLFCRSTSPNRSGPQRSTAPMF